MKHLLYKGGADVRSFDSDSLKRIDIDDDELTWDKRTGGVLEVKNATADQLMKVYPDDFEEVGSDKAEQLQMETFTPATVGGENNPTGDSATPATPAGATNTNRTRSSTKTG